MSGIGQAKDLTAKRTDMNLKSLLGEDKRTILIRKNIIASFAIKGWSGIVLFLLVPLTLKCLGAYENGIWLTISSMLLWIEQMDIGLGNGLRNKLAIYMAQDDIKKAQTAVSSTFAMLAFVMTITLVVILVIIKYTDIWAFLNVDAHIVPQLKDIASVVTILFCSSFVMKFTGNIYMGLQLPAINNMMVVAGQTLIFLATVVLYFFKIRSLMAIAIINTASPLLVYLIVFYITFYGKYTYLRPSWKFIDFEVAKELIKQGLYFFILQISGVVLFMSSNILISRFFSPDKVTPYQITYRYFSIILLVFGIISTPYWTATTDAFAKKDKMWIIKSGKRLNIITAIICLGTILMLLLSKPVYKIWIGGSICIPWSMSVAMSAYIIILVISLRYSCILNGLGKLRLQLILTSAAALSYIPLSILALTQYRNIITLIAIMCIVNIPGLIINSIQYKKLLNNTATGIWNR